jgi:hypothetical protein
LLSSHRTRQVGWSRDGPLAGEALANVDGWLAVHETLTFEQRDIVKRTDRDDRTWLERCERCAGDR